MNQDVPVKGRYSLRGVDRPSQALGVLATLWAGYNLTTDGGVAAAFWVLMTVLFFAAAGWGRDRSA
jgi:hypothetical protein